MGPGGGQSCSRSSRARNFHIRAGRASMENGVTPQGLLLFAHVPGNLKSVADELRLFAYGSLLPGEMHGELLQDAIRLGPATSAPGYRLVELDLFPALIESGNMQVEGELFVLSRELLRRTDELKENGRLFFRRPVRLSDGTRAEAYFMHEDKLRGRRRLRTGNWRKRFEPSPLRVGRRGRSY